MKKPSINNSMVSRRDFIKFIGATSGGIMLSPGLLSGMVAAPPDGKAIVATADISTYDETLLKDAVEQSFANLGGIDDIIQPGCSVGIKINLTGGAERAREHQLDSGLHPGETYWTNPVLLKVVGQAILDAGAGKLYILEALADWDSYIDFGYKEVVEGLGATFIDLNEKTPYEDFIQKSVGENYFIYPEFTQNGILDELDCLISMPKAKQHATSGVTHGMKNMVGVLPVSSGLYNDGASYLKGIHQHTVHDGIPNNNLCRVILDLNRSNPLQLVVNDAVKTVLGSEGPWTGAGITPTDFNKIIIGKDSVAVDSVSSQIMGLNPMAEDNAFPFKNSINYLKLASEQGLGEYDLNNIEIVDYDTGIKDFYETNDSKAISLEQNYPNPFNLNTTIEFHNRETMNVNIKVFDLRGREIAVLFDDIAMAGSHEVVWNASGFKSGIYYCKLKSGKTTIAKQMILIE